MQVYKKGEDMKDYYGVVYKATNANTGKSYIGITVQDFEKYKRRHIVAALRTTGKFRVFYAAIRKYGEESFEWEILEYCKSKAELCEMEISYIDRFNTYIGNPDCMGYNMTRGGEQYSYRLDDHPNRDEIRTKLSSIRKGKTYEEMYGVDVSDKLKQRRCIQMQQRAVSDKVKDMCKLINQKCYLCVNIHTKEVELIYSRSEVETKCGDSYYRITNLKTDWAVLDIVKVSDVESHDRVASYTRDDIKTLLDVMLMEHNWSPDTPTRNKRSTPNITKGKTYEDIYGLEASKIRKETWNGRKRSNI
jgi:group I intron endonuclease